MHSKKLFIIEETFEVSYKSQNFKNIVFKNDWND